MFEESLSLFETNTNKNSLLSKIGELRELVRASNAMVVGITESKLDDSINDCEICIEGCNIIRRD